jgi:hypothetical protein
VWSPELIIFAIITYYNFFATSSYSITWTNRGQLNEDVKGVNLIWASELNLFVGLYRTGYSRVFISSNGIN